MAEELKESKTERLVREAWNDAIEAVAKWLETADRDGIDDAKEIRKLKK